MKHTPGPWTAKLARVLPDSPVFGFRIVGGAEKWHGIAGCAVYEQFNAECFTAEEHEANASLIAAAPDLYEALRMLLEDGTLDQALMEPGRVSIARAALAKAEGRQS